MHSPWLHTAVHWMEAIQQAGWLGWFLFIGLYAFACLSFIPGSILTLGAGAIYGFWGGLALVLAGNGLGSVLSLLITRHLFRGWMEERLGHTKQARAVAKAVEHEGWKIVFLTRLSPIMPFSIINYSLGLTRISATRFLLATMLGSVPSSCAYVFVGKLIGNLTRIGPDLRHHRALEWWAWGAGLAVSIAATVYVSVVASRALKKHLK